MTWWSEHITHTADVPDWQAWLIGGPIIVGWLVKTFWQAWHD